MKENLQKFKNPWDALRAYNAGWNQNNWNNPETQNYVPTIQQKLKDNQQWETVSPNQSQTTPQQTTAPSTDGWSTVGTTSPQQPTSTALGAFGRGAETSALPTLGGLAAFTPGMEAGGAAGLAIGGPPGALIGGLAGGLATSMGAGYAVDKLQQYLLNKFPGAAKALGISQPQLQADVQQHPYAAFAGGLAPQALALRPSLEALTTAKGLIGAGAGAVIGGGQEAARELVNKEGLDTKKIAMATAAGALMNKPTFLGKAIGMGGPAEADTATTAASKIEATEAAKQANTPLAPGEQGQLFSQQETPATVSWLPEKPLDEAIAEDQQAQVNKRQMNLQLEQNPQTYYAGQEGVTAIHPDELTPFIEHTQNLTKAEQQSEPVQGNLFDEQYMQKLDQYGGQAEPKVLAPEEFAQTMKNIAGEPTTRFELPDNMEEAYNKYLDTVSDQQGSLFDPKTIADNFVQLSKQESVNRMLADNPVVSNLKNKVQAQSNRVDTLRAQNAPIDTLNRAQAALDKSQAKLDKTTQNIGKTLLGKNTTTLLPYSKDGVIYMNSGLPLPDWIKNGLTGLLQKFHGLVFRTLNSVLRGPRQINSLADTVHAGIKGAIDKQANKVWETNTNQNAAQVLRNLPLVDRNREAVRDFIPSDQKPVEEIAQMAREAPDVKMNKATENVLQGGLMMSVYTHNPLIKYTFDSFNRATKVADAAVKEFLTDRKTGLKPLVQKMNGAERAEIHGLMDRNEGIREFTPQELQAGGFNSKQIQYYQRFQEVMHQAWMRFNEGRAALGLPEVSRRVAYMAGRFMGDFRQLVFKKGTNEVVGFLGHNNKWTLQAIQKHFESMNPGEYDYGKIELMKSDQSRGMNRFNGYQNVLDFLSKTNADVSKIMDAYQSYLTQDSNRLMGAPKHALFKKETPVFGAEGKKAWLDMQTNADQGMKSQLQHAENMFRWSEMQKAAVKTSELLKDSTIDKPRAKEIADNYMHHALGQSSTALSKAFNSMLDGVSSATGFGPTYFRKFNSSQKSALLQMFLGWFRIPHSLINLTQYVQSNPAVMALLKARGLELPGGENMALDSGKGLMSSMKYWTKQKLDPFEQQAFDYAKKNQVFDIQLTSHLQDINKSRMSEWFREVTEANITYPEAAIRTSSFMTYAHMLRDAGLSTEEALGAADNLTKFSMVDYRPLERPQIYGHMGILGDISSTLTRFKMNQLSQYLIMGKEAGQGHVLPLATLAASSIALAGVTGLIGYNYANELYQLISTRVFDKPDSLDGLVMRNLPEWAEWGVFSKLGINLTASFSNADLIPNDPWAALFPTADTIAQIGKSAIDAARFGDVQSLKKLGYNIAPTSMKGIMENTMFSSPSNIKGPNGEPLTNFYNPQSGKLQTRRTNYDKILRDLAFRPVNESIENKQTQVVNAIEGKESGGSAGTTGGYSALRQKVMERVQHGIEAGNLTNQQLAQYAKQYSGFQGDPNEFASSIQKFMMDRQRTALERAKGIPAGSNLRELYRYKTYMENEPKK
ncbi:MAG: hypothetical protein KGI54_14830 [Pseudomonadota bacterium]|nr:hypothetical protein [Pseudomonadota bacterium]